MDQFLRNLPVVTIWSSFAPKTVEFLAAKMIKTIVEGVKKQKQSALYKPRAWRWAEVKKANNKSLVKVTNDEKSFNFRAYVHKVFLHFNCLEW